VLAAEIDVPIDDADPALVTCIADVAVRLLLVARAAEAPC
jgi:hypothetical protein